LIETGHRGNPTIAQNVAAAYGISGGYTAVTRPGVFASTPHRRRTADSEAVVVTIRGREPADKDVLPERPEGRHLVFRRVLAAYAKACDLSSAECSAASENRRVIDRTAVYRDRSYF
jgi:hypothetical protein